MNESTRAPLDLNQQYISAANDASQFDAGSVLAREAEQVYAAGLEDFTPSPAWTKAQQDYMTGRAAAWRELVTAAYNDIIRRRASWMPWTVCGPANYDARRNSAKADAQASAASEWSRKFAAFRETTKKQLAALRPAAVQIDAYRAGRDDSPISADDPLAIEKLTARLEYLREEHARNLALNKFYRKHGTMKGAPGLSDEGAARIDATLAALPACMRVVGFPANETANIRRLEQRLEQMKKARENAAQQDAAKNFEGFKLVKDAGDNRVRFYFDDKPDEQTRALLKGNGFKWSPRAGAWQRQMTENALRAADRIARALSAKQAEKTPQEMSLEAFAQRFAK